MERPHVSLVFNPSWAHLLSSFWPGARELGKGAHNLFQSPAIQVFPVETPPNPQHQEASATRHFCYSRQNSQMAPKIPPHTPCVYILLNPLPSVCVEGKGERLWIEYHSICDIYNTISFPQLCYMAKWRDFANVIKVPNQTILLKKREIIQGGPDLIK